MSHNDVIDTLLRTSRESEILYETFLLPYREIKEKKEKEKEEEHWILSWRPEFLRMEIDGAMIPVATPWDGMAVSTFKTVSEVDNDFRDNAHEDTTMADSIKCGVEIKRQGNHDGLNTHDLVSLIRLLKDKEPYRDETNKDVLFDYEIQFFAETYGITDFLLMFACGDWVFWLEDHGVIYFWSRIDDSMIRGGENLRLLANWYQ
ncbi:unnamed protein product [Rhizophagus irregularis]|nr:unnamed protein product [Rhizophagus irregularis]